MFKNLLGKSLAYRLTAFMTLVVVITLGIVIFLYIYLERDFASTTAEYQFSLINRTFDELISYINGKDHSIQPQQIIEKLGENSSINYITLYNNNGKPVISSVTSLQKPLSEKELKTLENLSYDHPLTTISEKTLNYIAPIRLRVSCRQCHSNGNMLGFIKISSFSATIYKHTFDMAKKLGLIFLSFLLIFGVVAIFISEFVVVKPLKEFVALIHKAELNNFLPRSKLTRKDEIGEIEDNFNQMLSRITNLMATSVEKERELVFVKEELKYKELLEKRADQANNTSFCRKRSPKSLHSLDDRFPFALRGWALDSERIVGQVGAGQTFVRSCPVIVGAPP
jgi:HAMP domain-containing protein